jgi:hypothetical protein
VSSVAFVLTFVLTLALLLAPERAKRAQQVDWWREVRAHGRAYEHVSFDPSPNEELVNGRSSAHAHANGAHANGAHANGAHANDKVPVAMILAAERQRGRLRRRRGRPQSPARHVRRHARRGLAHLTYSPGMRHFLRGTSGARSGTRPRRPASRASAAASRWRFTAESGRTGVGAR